MGDSIVQAGRLLRRAEQVVALTGAGISTGSGIPDFRSPGAGMWQHSDPALVASMSAFRRDPEPFYQWIAPLLATILEAEPNPAHHALAALEQAGKLAAVVTQNIDGLHQRAGSCIVLELHGHIRSATCLACRRRSLAAEHLPAAMRGEVPRCDCTGPIKPDVVLFDEDLPTEPWRLAVRAVEQCDLLLVAGTALEVYPSAGLPELALRGGAALVIVNYHTTWADGRADVVVRQDVAVALPEIVALAI